MLTFNTSFVTINVWLIIFVMNVKYSCEKEDEYDGYMLSYRNHLRWYKYGMML